jgi:membrane protease subunit (stomatin/prohibitin family)
MQQEPSPQSTEQGIVSPQSIRESTQPPRAHPQREQSCPQCGYLMSDLRGGREALCQNCGFKDSCCY